MTTIESELRLGIAQINTDSARLDAEVLLAYSLGKPRSHLFTWPEKVINTSAVEQFRALIQQRAQGQPISYLTGQREFWSLNFLVSPDVLIPRPETELLVETALNQFSSPVSG